MEEKKGKICKLCLEYIPEENFKVVNGIRTEMLKVLLVELNLLVSDEPVICSTCDGNLQICFDFKMTCLTTEDCIKTFANSPDTLKVNLQDVLLEEFAYNSIDGEKREICRLCFNLDSEVFTKLDTDLLNMLKKCLPEVNINLTNDPVICSFCSTLLKQVFDLVQACSKTEERIMQFYVTGTECPEDDSKIDLSDVKVEKVETSTDELQTQMDELGNYSCAISDLVKQEEQFEEEEMKRELEETKCKVDRNKTSISKKKKHKCHYCNNYEIQNICNLREHASAIHEKANAKVYYCRQCTFKIVRARTLRVHVRVHEEKAPYKCPGCGRSFKKKVYLDAHLLTHHDNLQHLITNRINYCKFCTYKTVFLTNLRDHITCIHNRDSAERFQCHKCNYFALQKSNLKRHLLVHSNTRSYLCSVCEKRFSRKKNLDSHILSNHTENVKLQKNITRKIHKCTFCLYTTRNNRNLHKHMKSKHKQI